LRETEAFLALELHIIFILHFALQDRLVW